MRAIYGAIILALGFVVLHAGPALAQTYEVPRYTIGSSGTMEAAGGAYAVSGTIGQHDPGIHTGGGYTVSGGFWVPQTSDPVDGPQLPPSPHDRAKNRFVSFDPNNPGSPAAIKVEMMDLACSVTGNRCLTDTDCQFCVGGTKDGMPCDGPAACPSGTCPVGETCNEVGSPILLGWVGEPVEAGNDAPAGTMTAEVVAAPVLRTWTEPVVHVGDCEIAPVHGYLLSATATPPGGPFTSALRINTIARPEAKFWADCVGNYTGTEWTGPNGLVNVDDVVAFINFKTFKPAPHITAIELAGSPPSYVNFIMNVTDLGLILQGFRAVPYPPLPFVLDGYPADMDLTNCP